MREAASLRTRRTWSRSAISNESRSFLPGRDDVSPDTEIESDNIRPGSSKGETPAFAPHAIRRTVTVTLTVRTIIKESKQ